MTRFFVRPEQIVDGTAILAGEDALHLERVLRAKVGDKIALLDGSGKIFYAGISDLSKSRVTAVIEGVEELRSEPHVAVTVAQALPKTADKLEWVLQHGVEAGAAAFRVFRSRRSEAGKLAEKPERWAKIVKTAAEQSGRARLPEALAVDGLEAVIARVQDFDLALLCDEAADAAPLRKVLTGATPVSVLVIIGPEGGWDDIERATAMTAGVIPISLGPRILRTETAALVALSQILYALDGG